MAESLRGMRSERQRLSCSESGVNLPPPPPRHLAELGPLPLPTGIKDGSREAMQGGLALIQAGDEGGLGQGDSDGEGLRNS